MKLVTAFALALSLFARCETTSEPPPVAEGNNTPKPVNSGGADEGEPSDERPDDRPKTDEGGDDPPPDCVSPTATKAAEGEACSVAEDCASGVCEGEGCERGGGRCMSTTRMCTRDLRQYCGCDDVTFQASGSCPGRRYRSTGECPRR